MASAVYSIFGGHRGNISGEWVVHAGPVFHLAADDMAEFLGAWVSGYRYFAAQLLSPSAGEFPTGADLLVKVATFEGG